MNAHTPGPWKRGECTSIGGRFNIVSASDDFLVCEMPFSRTTGEAARQSRANALLIAAAPDLYAATRLLLAANTSRDATDPGWHSAIAAARAAIASAEGAAPTPPTAAAPELNWLPIATLPDWDNRPWRQFILIDGERTRNGTRWGRKRCGEAFIRKDGPQGYRQEDIDRLLRDGDMDPWGWTVTHWMPARFPVFPIGGDAP